MEDQFVMKFPVYSLLLKDASGVILLRHGQELWLPLFTDKDAAQTYLERSEINECSVIELPKPGDLAAFLRDPHPAARGRRRLTRWSSIRGSSRWFVTGRSARRASTPSSCGPRNDG